MTKRRVEKYMLCGIMLALLVAIPALGMPCQEDVEKEKLPQNQEILDFEVVVNDHKGEPVKGAVVTPWAIGSAQGHGGWDAKSNGGMAAEPATTDSSGKATIRYPKYDNLVEQVRTTIVSISVKHPDHPALDTLHIPMPRKRPRKVKLPLGSAIEATILLDGEPVVDGIRTISTDGRGEEPQIDQDKKLIRIPPVATGVAKLLFVRLDGESITHFSPIEKVQIDGAEAVVKKEIELVPAVTLRGRLSDDVPRPVVNGRVKVKTITEKLSWEDVSWSDWAKVNEDGSFVIQSWPRGEPIQIVALCDGFIGKSGKAPPMIPPEQAAGGHRHPQAFLEPLGSEMVVEMESLSVCRVKVENAFGKRLKDVRAAASPNVGWWNGGSQIYCWPLSGTAHYLRTGENGQNQKEGIFAQPFCGVSDEEGIILVELPPGKKTILWAANERYQLPATLGSRYKKFEVERGKSMKIDMVLQPIGLDVLGDWEDLCGLVFG